MISPVQNIPPFAEGSKVINAIVDTPRGSANKFKLDEETGVFMLAGAMPAGVVFPFEFGYIPSTKAGDGDPLDLLILMDAPTFVGCLVHVRLIGVIEARQTEKGETTRNDRLIAVALKSRRHAHLHKLRDVPAQLLDEIEHFFISYNQIKGKKFKPTGRYGPKRALSLVEAAIQAEKKTQ